MFRVLILKTNDFSLLPDALQADLFDAGLQQGVHAAGITTGLTNADQFASTNVPGGADDCRLERLLAAARSRAAAGPIARRAFGRRPFCDQAKPPLSGAAKGVRTKVIGLSIRSPSGVPVDLLIVSLA